MSLGWPVGCLFSGGTSNGKRVFQLKEVQSIPSVGGSANSKGRFATSGLQTQAAAGVV